LQNKRHNACVRSGDEFQRKNALPKINSGNVANMAKQTINLGTAPTGVGGDTPRSAFQKTQSNFDELYQRDALLGTAANANIGTAAGNVMAVGAGGWLGPSIIDNSNANNAKNTGLYGLSNAANAPFVALQLLTSDWGVDPRWQAQLALGISQNKAYFRSILKDQTSATAWAELYHTGNTTKGSGGVLSAASPIVRVSNVAGSLRLDLLEQTFEPAGEWGVANEEARGVSVERLAVGEYRITGSLGLALEGWRTLDPCSPDGGRTLGITDSEQEPDGTVVIKLFKQRWTLSEDGEMIEGRGAALDVPLNSWIDVRLEMPKPEELPIPMEAIIEE
jgi:hypothetical protein